MRRRRPIDRVNWKLYRRAWALCVLAALLALVTSFRPERTPESPLPPTFSNEQAEQLIERAKDFDHSPKTSESFPDRRPGQAGALESALWLTERFEALERWEADTVTSTTTNPATGKAVSLVNVEAVLPGRTNEIVVVYAHRDNAGDSPAGKAAGDTLGTLTLLQLAEDLSATRDLRRTFLFVSTDGATLNGGGARALGERLAKRGTRFAGTRPGQVVAVVGLDRIGRAEGSNHVAFWTAGRHTPSLGLVQAAREALRAEGGSTSVPSLSSQLIRMAVPVTAHEHGHLAAKGLPAITLSGAPERPDSVSGRVSTTAYGDGVRALQRLLGTLDSVDTLQSAGKTYAVGEERVYRGWALKILMATFLIPVWVAAVDLVVRHRRQWNIAAAVGTAARACMAGIWAVCCLWVLGFVGLLPRTADRPPMPGTVDDFPLFGLLVWIALATGGWLLARGPDWRRTARGVADHADLAVCLLAGSVLAAIVLATNPYTVLLLAPMLHAWLLLLSRHAFGTGRIALIWGAGGIGLVGAVWAAGSVVDSATGAPGYLLQLVQSRTLPPSLMLPIAAMSGLAALALVAALGRVATPALPAVRRVVSDFTQEGFDARRSAHALVSRVRVNLPARGRQATRRQAPGERAAARSRARAVRRRVNSR